MLIKLCYTCVTCNVGFWCCHGRPRNLIPGNVERFSSRAHVHFCFNGKIGLVKWIVIEDAMLLGRSVGDVCATDAGPEIGKPPELGKLTTERKFLIKLAGFIRLMWRECWTGEKKKETRFHLWVNSWRRADGRVNVWESDTQLVVCASTQNNAVTWESVLGSDEFQRGGGTALAEGEHENDSVSSYQGSAWAGWTNKPLCVVLQQESSCAGSDS